ncbi:MAG: L-threonylcarbamoyladenylate synthase [Candidatus ainarchaeum sp.]|nr:L-threonylcarbamoyladenylate synthase [Candidatus ainarchaeum sp.]
MAETIKLKNGKKKAIEKALETLRKGKVIIFPTETSYGIGADALNEKAVEKVHKAKKQPNSKPISVIIADLKQAGKIVKLNNETRVLAKKFFPGPLTIIAPEKKVPKNLAKNGIAFRVPANKFARELCRAFGKPITATSANLHGEPAIFDSKELIEKFSDGVDLIIDAGMLPQKKASTIYCTINHKILREGKITKKEIEKALEKK